MSELDQLPEDPDALRDFLDGAVRELEQAAQQQAERRRKRLSTLLAYRDRLEQAGSGLEGTPEGERSARLRAAVDTEIAALKDAVGDLPEPAPAVAEAPSPEPGPEPAAAPRAPLPADAFERARELFEDAQKVKIAAPRLDIRELECLVNAQAGRARELQDSHPQFLNHDIDPGRTLHRTFGTFSSLAREFFRDRSIWVDALNQDYKTDWTSYSQHWEEELAEVRGILAEEAQEREAEAAAARRRQQITEANSRVFGQIIDEADEHIRYAPTDDDPIWALDLRDLVAEALDYGDPGDERLLDMVAPFAGLFAEGHAFRALRRKLRKEGEPVPASNSSRLEAVTGPITRGGEDPLRARFKGRMAGRKAAIVGGSCREYRRESIERFFGFESVEWVENEREQAANSRALATRIVNGHYDVIFMLARFTSHALHDKVKEACKESGVPFALVEGGYGISALCRALDALGDRAEALAGEPQSAS